VSCAGLIGGDRLALILVAHDGIDRREVEDVLHCRWSDLVTKSLEQEEPAWAMSPHDAACLGRRRRGIEPLRIVVMPQHDRQIAVPEVAPLPVLV
jgi:hypothetical protein